MAGQNALDSQLVDQAQQGDREALERLMGVLDPMLRAFFSRRIGARSEVDDLVQNTLLRVHRGLGELKDTNSLRAFAMKAALFELQDLYRGRYSAREMLYDPEFAPEQAGDAASSVHIDLERALSVLSPKARRIIELREYGFRYEEIAGIVGSTEAAIKMQVKRAFEKMRDVLAVWIAAVVIWFAS